MRILLASAHPYLPQIAGGAQSNMNELASALLQRGHDVAIVAGLTKAGFIGLRSRLAIKLGRDFHVDRIFGYPTIRSWEPWTVAGEIAEWWAPDVVVAQSGLPARIASSFREAGVPVVIHFHNVESDDLEGIHAQSGGAYIANSQFTARRIEELYGIVPRVIVPSFERSRYEVQPIGQYVTFINPHPKKGLDLMLDVVSGAPEQSFLFVKSWTLEKGAADELAAAARNLANLSIEEPVSDMRSVYRRTRLLVLPSQWEEAWGRVATEAQFSGIPVVGVDRGGIAEAIGPGGVILPASAGPDGWVSVIRQVLSDAARYEELSRNAISYSKRREIDLHEQIIAFDEVFACAIDSLARDRLATITFEH